VLEIYISTNRKAMKADMAVTMAVAIPIKKAAKVVIPIPMATTIAPNGNIIKPISSYPPMGHLEEFTFPLFMVPYILRFRLISTARELSNHSAM
jgi:hypothetical protein